MVQEEVILEDVVLTPPSPSKLHANFEPPRTPPRRRSLDGNTFHHAVLRSAPRAVLRAEKEQEEGGEELEVRGKF